MKRFSSALVCILSLSILFICGISMVIGGRNTDYDTIEDSKKEVLGYYHYLEVVGVLRRAPHQTRVGDVILLNTGFLTSLVARTDTATEIRMANSVIRFAHATENAGIPFLYIQIPHKIGPTEGAALMPPGESIAINENMDDHLRFLSAGGVATFDLRQSIRESGREQTSFFFRTDHHWTMESGLWAARILAEHINTTYRTNLDTSLLDPENFDTKIYPSWFLGSHGRQVTKGYISPDDFVVPLPKSDTDFRIICPDKGISSDGSFYETMFDLKTLNTKNYYENSTYETVIYGNRPLTKLYNKNNPNGLKILLLRDSFSSVVAPYLAMLCGEVDLIDVREGNGNYTGNLNSYRDEMQPDLVLAAYCFPIPIDRNET